MFSWIKSLIVKEPKQVEKNFKVYGKTIAITKEEMIEAQPTQGSVSHSVGRRSCIRCGRFVSKESNHTCPTK